MKAYSLFFCLNFCCIYRYTSIEYKPELKKFHSFDRFYVVTKFILPTANDINFSKSNFEDNCEYLKERDKV